MEFAKYAILGGLVVMIALLLASILVVVNTLDKRERTLMLKPTSMICQFLNPQTFMCIPVSEEDPTTPPDAKGVEKP